MIGLLTFAAMVALMGGSGVVIWFAIDVSAPLFAKSQWLYGVIQLAAFVLWMYLWVAIIDLFDRHFPIKRKKPDGYVGRFKRPDGSIVHVARVGGDLVVASEEPPGIFPKDLGNVSGREIMKWHKLATTPDGRSND